MDVQTLREIGWKACFENQLSLAETHNLIPGRVSAHWGSQVICQTQHGEQHLPIQLTKDCGDLAVGDWILLQPDTWRGMRRLERESLISRKAAGDKVQLQLIAANLDTLFIVSSCNHDFNLSRLERYLALAVEARVQPVVVLTKRDLCDSPHELAQQAMRLVSGLVVEMVDARDPKQTQVLFSWCGIGQTVALVGSSGVGKSTLATTLGAPELATQEIRDDDSKGRHTTTSRSLHQLNCGGLLIDTPGMRELQLADCQVGVDEVFDEILRLAENCRFRNCSHEDEPGCAVRAALESGELDRRRLSSYRKLQSEQARNARSLHERRSLSRKQGQYYKSVIAAKQRSKNLE